jgi:4-hydroxy-tetrahydrodipicolinate synthase
VVAYQVMTTDRAWLDPGNCCQQLEFIMSVTLAGVLPVLATPFTAEGEIDLGPLQHQIDWVLEQGADGLVMGMVSEALRLSSEERDSLAAAMCEFTAGRGTVTTSVGAESLHTAIRHARSAQVSGATAVMAIPPVATAASDDEILRYYSGIIEAIDIPVVVQDASGYMGRSLSVDLQARLYVEYGDQALFKPESPPIGQRLSELRDATGGGASIFEGTGGLALVDSFRRGIVGTMPGPDVVWALVALWKALNGGDHERVAALHGALCTLVSMHTSLDAFVSVQKHLLKRQGVLTNTFSRGPVGLILDAETTREVDRLFDRLRKVTFLET